MIFPLGSVYQYEDGTEFKLKTLQKDNESDEEYQARFKEPYALRTE